MERFILFRFSDPLQQALGGDSIATIQFWLFIVLLVTSTIMIGTPKRYKPYVLLPGLVVICGVGLMTVITGFRLPEVVITARQMRALMSHNAVCMSERRWWGVTYVDLIDMSQGTTGKKPTVYFPLNRKERVFNVLETQGFDVSSIVPCPDPTTDHSNPHNVEAVPSA